jgi:hypothetical protein
MVEFNSSPKVHTNHLQTGTTAFVYEIHPFGAKRQLHLHPIQRLGSIKSTKHAASGMNLVHMQKERETSFEVRDGVASDKSC